MWESHTFVSESSEDDKIKKLEDEINDLKHKSYESQLYGKSVGLSVVLSFLLGWVGIMGIGHIYAGRKERGLIILFAGRTLFMVMIAIVSSANTIQNSSGGRYSIEDYQYVLSFSAVSVVGYISLYLWQIIDARKICKIFNMKLLETGKKPW